MNRTAPPLLALPLAAGLCCSAAVAADDSGRALALETIEVVDVAPVHSIGLPLDHIPANVQSATAQSVAAQKPLAVSDLMRDNFGSVSINDTVGNPFQPDVSYRGFTASPLLGTPQGLSVFVDGVRVNEPFGDVVNWDLIPANAIAGINLIPGSNPVFGLNTLGGALAVQTKNGSDFPGSAVTATAGAWGRRAVEFESGGKRDALDYFVAGNLFHEDGWREHSPSDVRQLFGKFGWKDARDKLELTLLHADNRMSGTQGLPQSMLDRPTQSFSWPDSIGNTLSMATLAGEHAIGDDRLIAGNVYVRHNRAAGFNSNLNNNYPGDGQPSASTSVACNGVLAPSACDPLAANVRTTTATTGFGGALQATLLGQLAGHDNQFTGGVSADLGRTRFDSDSEAATVAGAQTVSLAPTMTPQTVRLRADNAYYGLYATDTFSLSDKLHLTASGRYNIARVDLSGSSTDITDASLAPGNLDGSHSYRRFNPALGFNYNLDRALGFYGSYNQGMRAPSPVELACADPAHPCALPNAFASDPHLKAVVSTTWEAGARGWLDRSTQWTASVYRTVNRDDILFVASNASGNGYFQNVGETLREGLELGLRTTHDKWTVAANYGYTRATFRTAFSEMAGANSSADANGVIQVGPGSSIPGIPRQTLKLRVEYAASERFGIGSNIVMAASQYARGDENNRDASGKVAGYAVVNADAHYATSDRWTLFAKVANVFDRRYSTFGVLGVNEFTGPGNSFSSDPAQWRNEQFQTPAPPRALWIGATYAWDKPKSGTRD